MQAITDQEMRERLSAYPELKCEGKDVKFTSSHPEAQVIRVDCRVPEPHQIAYSGAVGGSSLVRRTGIRRRVVVGYAVGRLES